VDAELDGDAELADPMEKATTGPHTLEGRGQ
jgi:hypothetical protein